MERRHQNNTISYTGPGLRRAGHWVEMWVDVALHPLEKRGESQQGSWLLAISGLVLSVSSVMHLCRPRLNLLEAGALDLGTFLPYYIMVVRNLQKHPASLPGQSYG